MITALATSKSGQRMVILGLDGENMTRLMAKEPIHIHLDQTVPGAEITLEIVLMGGRSAQHIVDQLIELGWMSPDLVPIDQTLAGEHT